MTGFRNNEISRTNTEIFIHVPQKISMMKDVVLKPILNCIISNLISRQRQG